jgi:putative flavoprotein involved in K+ transport
VGAGPAGLSASQHLLEAGVEHVVLERHDVADTWRRQRWDSFTLNTPDSMNDGLRPENDLGMTCPRDEVVRLLALQAENLPVRTRTPVRAVTRQPNGFLVSTPDGDLTTRSLILASGLRNVPKTPTQAARLTARVRQLHTADYRSPHDLVDGAVLVVGGGQSGCQIAEDLALAGRTVYLSTSRVGRIPWLYRGRELLTWLVECGYWDQSPLDLPRRADAELAIALVAGGRSLDLPILSGLGVQLLGRVTSADGELVSFDGSVVDHAAYADAVAAQITRMVDEHIAQRGILAPDRVPDARARDPLPRNDAASLNLRSAGVNTVIWSTGFTGDLSWVHLPLMGSDGRPQHDGCAAPSPGVWYVGFPWLTRRSSGIFHGFSRDARTVVDAVLHDLES